MIFESDEIAQNNPTTRSTDDFPQCFDWKIWFFCCAGQRLHMQSTETDCLLVVLNEITCVRRTIHHMLNVPVFIHWALGIFCVSFECNHDFVPKCEIKSSNFETLRVSSTPDVVVEINSRKHNQSNMEKVNQWKRNGLFLALGSFTNNVFFHVFCWLHLLLSLHQRRKRIVSSTCNPFKLYEDESWSGINFDGRTYFLNPDDTAFMVRFAYLFLRMYITTSCSLHDRLQYSTIPGTGTSYYYWRRSLHYCYYHHVIDDWLSCQFMASIIAKTKITFS